MGRMKDLTIDNPDYELDYDNYVEYPEQQLVFPEFVEWSEDQQDVAAVTSLFRWPQQLVFPEFVEWFIKEELRVEEEGQDLPKHKPHYTLVVCSNMMYNV